MTNEQQKLLIGRTEWCELPQLNVPAIKARIDSGAKTSSIHAFNIKPIIKNNEDYVSFEIDPIQNDIDTVIYCELPVADKRKVKSSSGETESRYVVNTTLSLGGRSWEIQLTLTNRDAMGYRMLLGREAMNGNVIIDPERACLLKKISDKKIHKMYEA